MPDNNDSYTVGNHDSSPFCLRPDLWVKFIYSGVVMDSWLEMIIRQLILYSLPVLISLSCVIMVEARLSKKTIPHPFYALSWSGTWLPLLASLAFHRGIIIALPNHLERSVKSAALHVSTHAILCLLGFLLYTWSLALQAPVGLPPLHHWWAKVLMFFNLCMVCLHLLPLPALLVGRVLSETKAATRLNTCLNEQRGLLILILLAASPLLDLIMGANIVFPIYESLSSLAMSLSSHGL